MASILLPTRQVEKQEAPKESALDKLLKGLQVAGSAFGIASDISNLTTQSQARELARAREGREQAKFGIETQRTTMEAPEGQPGTPITLQTPEGESLTSLRVPRPQEMSAMEKANLEYKQAQIAQLKKNPQGKAFSMTPEQEQYYIDRGVDKTAIDLVKAGLGGRNPVNTLNNLAEKDEPTSAEISVLNGFDESAKILGEITAGAKAGWTGPVDGRVPDYFADQEEVGWRSKIGRFNDSYRKAITGAGASEQELQRLETRMPQPTDTLKNFKAKAKELMAELNDKREIYLNSLEKGGKYVKPLRELGSTTTFVADRDIGNRQSGAVNTSQGQVAVDDNIREAALEELRRRKAAAQQTQPGMQVPRS